MVLGLLLTLVAGAAVGLAIPRWWLLAVPPVLVVVWIALESIDPDPAADSDPWVIPAFVGGWLAVASMAGLAIGIAWGRFVRDRRAEAHRAGSVL